MAVAAFAAVAVPLVGSQVVDQGSQVGVRGGGAISTTRTSGATTPATIAATMTTSTTSTGAVAAVPRSKHSVTLAQRRGGGAKKALPLTT